MRKERVQILHDSFTDEYGKIRNFTIAAISIVFTEDDEPVEVFDNYGNPVQDIVKGVKLGWAICNPTDVWSADLGERIAIGRARANSRYALFADKLGYINNKLIQAFLEQEAEYFKANPQTHIAGYVRKK